MEVETSSPLRLHVFRNPAWNESPSAQGKSTPTGGLFGPKLNVGPDGEIIEQERSQTSPTTCLAKDLSKNFHIDQTPVQPTPRRSLFSNLDARSMVTTPPIPPSSPGNETMEISPLPHKAAYKRMPFTPDYGGRDMGMGLCSSPPTGSPVRKPLARPKLAERKISRPSLLRQGSRMSGNSASFKTQSSGSISFGRSPATPQVNLEELFSGGASPEGKRIGSAAGFLGSPPSKPFAIANAEGSPVAPPARQCRPAARPKGKIRRTMSMFEHPQEVVHHVANEELSTSPKTGAGENAVIPSFNVKDDPLRRINRATLISIMDGEYKEHFDEYKIIDCRFEYEFEGGHIAGATNINSIDRLEETFFAELQEDKRQLIIFHCEYSAHRAPRMALHLRKRDRLINMHRYPALNFPDIYVLEGGYSSFFSQHKLRCDPQHYVEMDDEKHKRTCEREMNKFRRNHNHKAFSRTQSFTYGIPPENDGSPSAGLASKRPSCGSGGLDIAPPRSRRMATY